VQQIQPLAISRKGTGGSGTMCFRGPPFHPAGGWQFQKYASLRRHSAPSGQHRPPHCSSPQVEASRSSQPVLPPHCSHSFSSFAHIALLAPFLVAAAPLPRGRPTTGVAAAPVRATGLGCVRASICNVAAWLAPATAGLLWRALDAAEAPARGAGAHVKVARGGVQSMRRRACVFKSFARFYANPTPKLTCGHHHGNHHRCRGSDSGSDGAVPVPRRGSAPACTTCRSVQERLSYPKLICTQQSKRTLAVHAPCQGLSRGSG
jgi:hypothetical protein